MAAVESYQNGGKYINEIDGEDPEYVRQMMRPVEVKEDVRQMEERKRVKQILHSQAFCEELQELVLEQFNPSSVRAAAGSLNSSSLLSDIIMPHARATLMKKGVGPCIPVADVMDYDRGERQFRCRLASLYRLVDLFGWSHGINSYITGRINQDFEHFLIAAYGILHHEVTASSLVKVDMRGEILDPGSTNLGVNKTGFSLHSAIYASRPDIKCVVHLRNTPALSVSAMNAGLMPLCSEAQLVGDVSFVEYSGGFLDLEQRDRLRRAIGPINKVFILRNFGIIVGGETIEEAFSLTRNVMIAVEHQLGLIKSGGYATASAAAAAAVAAGQQLPAAGGEEGKKPQSAEQLFEALMRHLDNYGYRTGYIYREQATATSGGDQKVQSSSDVAIPPSTTSFNYTYEEGGDGRVTSPVRGRPPSSQGGRIKQQQPGSRQQQQQEWSSYSSRAAAEQSLDDTNVLDTTKTSKWAPEDTSTPIKPDSTAARKEIRKKDLETTMTEERYAAERRTETQSSPQKSPVAAQQPQQNILHDREPSQERSLSGRETPGSKDKKKKKWPFGSKKKETE